MSRTLSALAFVLVGALAPPALAEDPRAPAGMGFGEAPSETSPAAPSDAKGLLAECDRRLDVCERDAIGVPYLAAAYMALWVLLLGFLVAVRRGQRTLEIEIEELRRRLREVAPP